MSWFKRRPRTKEPGKTFPQHTSPMTEKKLEQSKERAPKQQKTK